MTNRGGLADVLVSAGALLGVPGTEDRLRLAELAGSPRRICVLLIDGMGYHLLPSAAPHAPLLADVLAGRTGTLNELSCSFPSTTPTSLATLGTGTLPGAHGVLGFTVNVPGTDRVLTHVRWRDDPAPRAWQPEPSLFDRAEAAGTRVAVVSRPEFAGSGLTIAAYGTPRYVGAAHAEQLATGALAELAAGPGLVYGYHPTLDAVAHEYGVASPDWARAAAAVDRLIARIVDGLPDDAALFVTADHGALDVPADGRVDMDADPRLTAGVRVVAGEPRVRYLHTLPGAAPDVLATWRELLAGRARVLARDEAVTSGLFGPVRDEHLARIGDVVVIAEGTTVVLASAHEPESVGKLVAFHGALTPAETAIPLIGFAAG
ncbi:MAG TPA: nucleotide pyrophosphatase/phosphodiesterase family protein [Jatrophihabitantaceae bacterium]|nr:nucleotide pyrophosphatase/phosphodiesterase family protein [Jatrophihabitantaceae bacterium]